MDVTENLSSWTIINLSSDKRFSLKYLGPFSSTEMAEWFSAGYFTMNLLVKRDCDDLFQPLGELIKRWGRVPFLNGPTPPPLKVKMFRLIISSGILS